MGTNHLSFGATADPSRYYPALGQEVVSSRITSGLREGEPFQVVLGESGSGKTTLAMRWLGELDTRSNAIFLPAKRYPDSESILGDLAGELGLHYQPGSVWALRRLVEDALLNEYQTKRTPLYLLIDGAQHLSDDSLADLAGFTNLVGTNGPIVSLVLLGHPGLMTRLEKPDSGAEIKSYFPTHMIPRVEREELADFARHQIRMAGLDPDSFMDLETLDFLVSLANGNMGSLVLFLRLSWRFARIHGMEAIDIEAVEEARDSIHPTSAESMAECEASEPALVPHGISA